MNHAGWLGAALVLCLPVSQALAGDLFGARELERANRHLRGQIVDHTHNHGQDHRIWSAALQERRDLYVYLPPGYSSQKAYPLVLWLHGFAQDEHSFLQDVAPRLDEAIACGKLPPFIAAAPDGSLTGRASYFSAGSFFVNSKLGRFEDFVVQDVLGFVAAHYPIRPEREARVLAGVSMGGGGAYSLGMKYRSTFKVVIGIFPPLNTRWVDCHGRYMRNFDPECWGWRTDFSRGHEVVARFYGVVTVRLKQVIDPLYNRKGPNIVADVALENPIEIMERLDLREGELSMYLAYGGKDQFNIDAQVESFLYAARQRGLNIQVAHDPRGRHDLTTAVNFLPGIIDWLAPQLAPYSP